MHIFQHTHFDFLRWRVHAIVLSWIIIIAGGAMFLTKGIPLGIEFAGGTAVIVKFEQPTGEGWSARVGTHLRPLRRSVNMSRISSLSLSLPSLRPRT